MKEANWSNHEIWRKCKNCGAHSDLRASRYCSECRRSLEHVISIAIITFIFLLLTSCKPTDSLQSPMLPITTNAPADSCMTTKQYRMRLNFVKDSMRIAARVEKAEIKYIYRTKRDSIYLEKIIYKFDSKRFKDSLNTYQRMFKDSTKAMQKMYGDSMRALVPITKAQEKTERSDIRNTAKTDRTEIRQVEKTKRYKWWMWLAIGFVSGILISNIKIRSFI